MAQAFNIAFERWQTHKKKKAAAIEKAKGEASAGATNGGRGGGATEARTDSIDGSIGVGSNGLLFCHWRGVYGLALVAVTACLGSRVPAHSITVEIWLQCT